MLGPPPTSGTRDAFVELVMDVGCAQFPEVKALPADQAKAVCSQIREDGAYVEAGENDNLIVQKLVANKDAYGVFGYSFLEQNLDKLQGAKINGVAPDLRHHRQRQVPGRPVDCTSTSRTSTSMSFPASRNSWPSTPASARSARKAIWKPRA